MKRYMAGSAVFFGVVVWVVTVEAACNAPNAGLVTLTISGPEYVGVGTTNDYTLVFSPSSVDTNGGTFAWTYTDLTVVGSDSAGAIKLVAPPTPSATFIDKKTVKCEFSKTGWSSASECSAQKKVTVMEITHTTKATVPLDRTRTKLGVGEKVTFEIKPVINKMTWTATAGKFGIVSTKNAFYTAPNKGKNDELITATYEGYTYSASFEVVEPKVENALAKVDMEFPAGTHGVGMKITPIEIGPSDVSFAAVEVKELPGPASNIWGYYTNVTRSLAHQPTSEWIQLNKNNHWADTAWHSEDPSPWSLGGFEWDIPVKWRVKADNNYEGSFSRNRTQIMQLIGTNGAATLDS